MKKGLQVFKDMRREGARGDGQHRLSDKRGALMSVWLDTILFSEKSQLFDKQRDQNITHGPTLLDFSMCVLS